MREENRNLRTPSNCPIFPGNIPIIIGPTGPTGPAGGGAGPTGPTHTVKSVIKK